MFKRQKNQLRAGVILGYVNLALGTLIPFFYTPVMLKMLGQEEYGLFSLSSSVISYLSLLKFGFGITITRYLSKYRAEENKEELEKVVGFYLLLYSAIALLILIIGFSLTSQVDFIFSRSLTGQERFIMRKLMIVMTISTSVSLPISVFSSLTIAYERYIFRNILSIIGTVVAPLANLIALWMGYRSVGMAIAGLTSQLILLPWSMVFCIKKLNVHPRFARLPGNLIKEMVYVSFFNFLGTVVDMLFWSTDKVLLGILASSVAVAIYNIGATFNGMIVHLSTTISGVLTPKVTGMVVKNADSRELTELFVRVGRLQFLIIGLVVSGFITFGKQFIEIWAGFDYQQSYYIALLTIVPLSIPLIQNTGITIMVAQNKQKFRSVVYTIIAVINVISTYCIIPYLGGIGAALCSCLAYLAGQGIIMNIYYSRAIHLDIVYFWKNIIHMALVPAGMSFAAVLLLNVYEVANWSSFFIAVFIYSFIYGLLMYYLVMNNYEKDIVRVPFKKIKVFLLRK